MLGQAKHPLTKTGIADSLAEVWRQHEPTLLAKEREALSAIADRPNRLHATCPKCRKPAVKTPSTPIAWLATGTPARGTKANFTFDEMIS